MFRVQRTNTSFLYPFSFGSTTSCHITTVCQWGVLPLTPFSKSSSYSGTYATSPPVPEHLGNAIGHPMPGLGSTGLGRWIEDLFATSLLVLGHLGFAIGRPTPSKGHRQHEVTWFSGLDLVTFPSFIKDGDSHIFQASEEPISSQGKHCCESSNSIIVTKDVQIVDVDCRFFRRL